MACRPKNIIGVALNYPGIEGVSKSDEEPLIFLKSPSVIGDKQNIISPFTNLQVWGEPELAIVLGPKLSKPVEKKLDVSIFGYTIANDVTVIILMEEITILRDQKVLIRFVSLVLRLIPNLNLVVKK